MDLSIYELLSEIYIDSYSMKSYFDNVEIKSILAIRFKIIAFGMTNLRINSNDNNVKAAPFEINEYDTIYLLLLGVIKCRHKDEVDIVLNLIKDKLFSGYLFIKLKEYYLLSGIKYGCDYMVYKGRCFYY